MLSKIAVLLTALVAGTVTAAAPPAVNETSVTPGSTCASLGPMAFDVAYNFMLSAYNPTVTTQNDTGVPLVLGQAGASYGVLFKVLSTYASYPYNQWPTLSIIDGVLYGNGEHMNPAEGFAPAAGTQISFVVPPQGKGDKAWCGLANTDTSQGGGYARLALNGDANSFSLCPASDKPDAQVNVVYKPSADNYGEYVYSKCYPVTLHMTGQY